MNRREFFSNGLTAGAGILIGTNPFLDPLLRAIGLLPPKKKTYVEIHQPKIVQKWTESEWITLDYDSTNFILIRAWYQDKTGHVIYVYPPYGGDK